MQNLRPFLLLHLRILRRKFTLRSLLGLLCDFVLAIVLYFFLDMSILAAFGLFFVAIASQATDQPFSMGEVGGSDALLLTLPLPAKTVITGRYLFALGIIIASAGAMSGLYLLLAPLFPPEEPQFLFLCLSIAVSLILFSSACSFVWYTKCGYDQITRLQGTVPLMLLLLLLLVAAVLGGEFRLVGAIFENPLPGGLALLLFGLGSYLLSALLSYRLYCKRSF